MRWEQFNWFILHFAALISRRLQRLAHYLPRIIEANRHQDISICILQCTVSYDNSSRKFKSVLSPRYSYRVEDSHRFCTRRHCLLCTDIVSQEVPDLKPNHHISLHMDAWQRSFSIWHPNHLVSSWLLNFIDKIQFIFFMYIWGLKSMLDRSTERGFASTQRSMQNTHLRKILLDFCSRIPCIFIWKFKREWRLRLRRCWAEKVQLSYWHSSLFMNTTFSMFNRLLFTSI